MTERRDILNVAEIPTRTIHTGPRFEVALGDIDGVLGTAALGATLHVVPAGRTAWPYHRHHGNDEIFFVLAGEGTYRVGDRRLPIRAGDLIGASAGGEAHQIINSGDGEMRYIAFANRSGADLIEYPDSGKVAMIVKHNNDRHPPSFIDVTGRLTPTTEYWDGEDMEGDKNG